jgi:two-component system, NarL family, response regulator NreC
MAKDTSHPVITIVLADDHYVLRQGLRSLIDQEPDMTVVGEAENGWKLIEAVTQATPDVVVMDISMPDLNGIDATRHVLERAPATRILALSMHSDKRMVSGMLGAGAMGYLLKDCAFDEIAQAIRTVAANRSYLSPSITDVVVDDYVRRVAAEDTASFAVLSPREREVLQLLAEGNPTREIAAKLFVSVKTIETHRRQIMEKLHLFSVSELTKYAIREGLTSLDK